MKIILKETQYKRLVKLINEQSVDPEKAASGPQKCGLGDLSSGGESSRESRQWDKEVAKQDKQDQKDIAKEFQNYLNPKVDRSGYKIDKNDFNASYQNFIKSNPDFESDKSSLSPAQRFGILYKEAGGLKSNPYYYLRDKLNNMFGRKGNPEISMQQFYNDIKNMGGFDQYITYYKQGFPTK